MSRWPKMVFIHGVSIPVESWEELDELVNRYGKGGDIKETGSDKNRVVITSTLSHSDRSLLQQFVEKGSRGLLNAHIGRALGKVGKGIRPELETWSRRIGLVTQHGASAFERVQTAQGRGCRLAGIYVQAARSMLSG